MCPARVSCANLSAGASLSIKELLMKEYLFVFVLVICLPFYVFSQKASDFRNNRLTSVTLSNGLKTISDELFRNNQLTAIVIPNGVTNLLKIYMRPLLSLM